MVVGLKLDGKSVPSSGILGGFVDLSCDFNVETDTLLKLQWYKNDGEFFRYSPGTKEPSSIATFAQPGVHVDVRPRLFKIIPLKRNIFYHLTFSFRYYRWERA